MKARFPIGLVFKKKRYSKAEEFTTYMIGDIYTTFNSAGDVVKIDYLVYHDFMEQLVSEFMCDTAIARSLTNEQQKEYVK